jgi:ribosomal protein L19
MRSQADEMRSVFQQLRPGDRVEVEHLVTVGLQSWTAKTAGTVVSAERRRHGLHFRRNFDDKVFSDAIVIERPDGELTTVTLDEFTVLRRVEARRASEGELKPEAQARGERGPSLACASGFNSATNSPIA